MLENLISQIETKGSRADTLKQISQKILPLIKNEDKLFKLGALTDLKKHFHLDNSEFNALKCQLLSPDQNKQLLSQEPIQIALIEGSIDVCTNDQGVPIFCGLEDGSLIAKKQILRDGKIFIPPPKEAFTWLLPRFSQVQHFFSNDEDIKLFLDVEELIQRNVELPDQRLYSFFTAWIFHTHLLSKFRYSPIIILYSDAEHGKTRLGKLLTHLSRSGEITESLNEANIFRKAERFEATFFFDVLDLWKKAERSGSEDALLSRFERDHRVARVTHPEKKGFEDTQHFKLFGPTIIASNEPAHHILESRGVTVVMRKSKRIFPDLPSKEELIILKERLTALHCRWFSKNLPQTEKISLGRLGDILKPIHQILLQFAPEQEKAFRGLTSYFEGIRAESKSDSFEGRIIQALLDLNLSSAITGTLKKNTILEKLNKDQPSRYQSTLNSLSRKLRSLGFQDGPRDGNERTINYDDQLVETLSVQYGLASDTTGKTGLSDVIPFPYDFTDAGSKPDLELPSTIEQNWQFSEALLEEVSSDPPDFPDSYSIEERIAIQEEDL